ncbi:MAG: PorV/PorQ family protein [candidate division FCPU426 bacterium]
MVSFQCKDCLRLLVIVCLLSAYPCTSRAGGQGTSSAEFLRIPSGARPAGMGGAYTAIADDAGAVVWNPAGLALIRGGNLTLMHLQWFADTNYESVAYAQSIADGEGLGFNVAYFWIPDFNSTRNENGVLLDSQPGRMRDLAAAMGYGKNLGWVSLLGGQTRVGGTVKLISRTLMEESRQSVLFDGGVAVTSDDQLTVSLVMQNLGLELGGEEPPFTLKLGCGYSLPFQTAAYRVQLALDLVKPVDFNNQVDQRLEYNLGVECRLLSALAVRLGFQGGQDLPAATAGLGVRLSALELNYAFAAYDFLGYAHTFSLSVVFP